MSVLPALVYRDRRDRPNRARADLPRRDPVRVVEGVGLIPRDVVGLRRAVPHRYRNGTFRRVEGMQMVTLFRMI